MALLIFAAAKGATVAQYKMRQQRERSGVIVPVDGAEGADVPVGATNEWWRGEGAASMRTLEAPDTERASRAESDGAPSRPSSSEGAAQPPPSSSSSSRSFRLETTSKVSVSVRVPVSDAAHSSTAATSDGGEANSRPQRTASLPVTHAPPEQAKRRPGQGSSRARVDDGSFNYARRAVSARISADVLPALEQPPTSATLAVRPDPSVVGTELARRGGSKTTVGAHMPKPAKSSADDGSFHSMLQSPTVAQRSSSRAAGSCVNPKPPSDFSDSVRRSGGAAAHGGPNSMQATPCADDGSFNSVLSRPAMTQHAASSALASSLNQERAVYSTEEPDRSCLIPIDEGAKPKYAQVPVDDGSFNSVMRRPVVAQHNTRPQGPGASAPGRVAQPPMAAPQGTPGRKPGQHPSKQPSVQATAAAPATTSDATAGTDSSGIGNSSGVLAKRPSYLEGTEKTAVPSPDAVRALRPAEAKAQVQPSHVPDPGYFKAARVASRRN
jgi:hypothetical protein